MSASILPLTSKASKALRMVSSSSAPPAIFSAKSITICVKLTGPGASASMPCASPSETDLPTELKAATMSEEDRRPSLSASMIPKASLNSWICLWEKRAKTLEPLFLAFFDPEPLAIVCLRSLEVSGLETAAQRSRAGGGGGGDAEDGVDLVDDHVPDHANDEVLHQSSVSNLVGLALLSRDGAGEGQGADEESNEEGLDHVGGSNDWTPM